MDGNKALIKRLKRSFSEMLEAPKSTVELFKVWESSK